MQHEIPVKMFPNLLNSITLLSDEDTETANEYINNNNLAGLLAYLRTRGIGFDDHNFNLISNTCKDVVFTLDIPDEVVIGQETTECKSIW